MKYYLMLFFIIKASFLFGQVEKDSQVFKQLLVTSDLMKVRGEKLKSFADSINCYKTGKIPTFLLNKCFDYSNTIPAISFHAEVSTRWLILEKVNNKKALKRILNSKERKINCKCKYALNKAETYHVPLSDLSFYELIKKRYKEL